ncbi:MAG: N-acetyl-gamma-glutamyl-phosphate reductase [Magnetococcales bacterium]|nr:N-acetyl-gamma-glutamyl-phosphate reductase [Magnetococcales bacterium]
MATAIGIVGATGYTGGELIRLLARHPAVELTQVTSEKYAGQPLSNAFPHLLPGTSLICQKVDPDLLADSCQLVFCALPHKTSMEVIPGLLDRGLRVIDLSADFRLHDPATYAEWYGTPHLATEALAGAVYGLPELHGAAIAKAKLVANPGCYPTSVILGLAPLLGKGLVEEESLIVDSKSGVSGAGRSPALGNLYPEVADGLRAYKVVGHRHIPEMEQELSLLAGKKLALRFTPHLMPQIRGILSTSYLRMCPGNEKYDWASLYRAFYRDCPFVRLMPGGEAPATNYVRGSNYCFINLFPDPRTGLLVVVSVIDNLVKGASGQAVQNMNLLLGWPETTGLEQLPLFP